MLQLLLLLLLQTITGSAFSHLCCKQPMAWRYFAVTGQILLLAMLLLLLLLLHTIPGSAFPHLS
jgi:hypothetical protein